MNQEKYIGMDVHHATISVAVMDAGGKLIMECLLETKSVHDCRVHPRIARNSVTDLRGRHVRGLVTRSSETPREPAGGLRPAKERSFEGWQQERPDRRAQASRVVTRQPTPSRVPRRAWGSHLERAGAQLSDHHPGCHPRHESHQSAVPDVTKVNLARRLIRHRILPS